MTNSTFIKANKLIDGTGGSFNNAVIEISNDLIRKIGNEEDFSFSNDSVIYETNVVMPGLWDCHTHLFGGTSLDMLKWMEEPATLRAIRATQSVRYLLEAGYTSVRDVGGPFSLRLKTAINEGRIPGPHIYGAHKFISQTAGHGDNHSTPLNWQSSEHAEWYARLADGVDECRKATRENIREGADLIKIFVTGGVLSQIDSPHQSHFSLEELRAIVEEAHRFDLTTSAHAHGLEGIKKAIEAGITTIEHGTYLDDKAARLMSEKNIILVPTFTILSKFIEVGKRGLPDYILEKLNDVYENHKQNIKIAVDHSVKIAAGSDLLGIPPYDHGFSNAAELKYLENVGLSAMDSIVAATSAGPLTLGKKAPNTGVLKEGKIADILCLENDPLENLTTLQDKSNIKMVFKNGNLVAKAGNLV